MAGAEANSEVHVNGIAMAYDDHAGDGGAGGAGTIVLIHGQPFNRSMWTPQVGYLARSGWRVIAPDLRGFGQSSVIPDDLATAPVVTDTLVTGSADAHAWEAYARDIAALLDALGIGRVFLGGLSMGGQVAMECYRLFPERVTGLLLADTFPEAETRDGRQAREDLADRLLREGMLGYADEVLAKMMAPYNVEAMPEVAEHVRAMMLTTSPAGNAAAHRARARRPDYTALLTTVSVPALVVVGSDDEYTPVPVAERMSALIPNAELSIVYRAGHLPNLERPTEFNAALHGFLEEVAAGVPGH